MHFGSKKVKYLGQVIAANGIAVGNDRITAVRELPDQKHVKESRSFLGALNVVSRFVPNFADITAPLVELTKKRF